MNPQGEISRPPERAAATQYHPAFIRTHSVAMLGETPLFVEVGCTVEPDCELVARLVRFHQKQVKARVITRAKLAEILRAASKTSAVTGASPAPARPGTGEKQKGNDEAEGGTSILPALALSAQERIRSLSRVEIDRMSRAAPTVELVDAAIRSAIAAAASDIHVETGCDNGHIRFRVDGVLRLWRELDAASSRAVIARVKSVAGLNVLESRLPQDGRISLNTAHGTYDLRVSAVPALFGESLVIRLFQREWNGSGIKTLGFRPGIETVLHRTLAARDGLFLVCGPAGSGKTTTLHAILWEMDRVRNKIIAVEDPVERVVAGVTHINVNEATGLTFDRALRCVLRHNPDVILIGELRDEQTAATAIRAALTGHTVLTTLHARTAGEALPRMINLGATEEELLPLLRWVLAQRLLRRPCPQCRGGAAAFFDSAGNGTCGVCGGSGYHGRVPVGELLLSTGINRTIQPHAVNPHPGSCLRTLDECSLHQDALRAAAAGFSSKEEVDRVLGEK